MTDQTPELGRIAHSTFIPSIEIRTALNQFCSEFPKEEKVMEEDFANLQGIIIFIQDYCEQFGLKLPYHDQMLVVFAMLVYFEISSAKKLGHIIKRIESMDNRFGSERGAINAIASCFQGLGINSSRRVF